jgi:hypothetical protein
VHVKDGMGGGSPTSMAWLPLLQPPVSGDSALAERTVLTAGVQGHGQNDIGNPTTQARSSPILSMRCAQRKRGPTVQSPRS